MLGAITANCKDQKILSALQKYAKNLGLAFQINDDILDIEGNIENLGKSTNMDQKSNKPTYPAIMGIKESKQKLQNLQQEAIDSLNNIPCDNTLLIWLINHIINKKN